MGENGNEFWPMLELVPGNCFTRVKRGLHGESCPDVDHAEKFVNDLVGVVRAGPPSRGVEVVVGDGVDDYFSTRGAQPVPQFVHAAGVGFIGHHNHRSVVVLPKSAADHSQFVLGVDDRGVENVNGFCRDSLAAENLIIEIGFTWIVDAHFGQRIGLWTGMGQPDLASVTSAIKRSRFESARGKITAEHGDGVCFLKGIFFDEPAADSEHEGETGGQGKKRKSAEYCENAE